MEMFHTWSSSMKRMSRSRPDDSTRLEQGQLGFTWRHRGGLAQLDDADVQVQALRLHSPRAGASGAPGPSPTSPTRAMMTGSAASRPLRPWRPRRPPRPPSPIAAAPPRPATRRSCRRATTTGTATRTTAPCAGAHDGWRSARTASRRVGGCGGAVVVVVVPCSRAWGAGGAARAGSA